MKKTKGFTAAEIEKTFENIKKSHSPESAYLHANLMRAVNASHLSYNTLDFICGTNTGIRKIWGHSGMMGVVMCNRVARSLSVLFDEHYTIDDLISRDIDFPDMSTDPDWGVSLTDEQLREAAALFGADFDKMVEQGKHSYTQRLVKAYKTLNEQQERDCMGDYTREELEAVA